MKKVIISSFAAFTIFAIIATFTQCANNSTPSVNQSEVDSLRNQIKTLTAGKAKIETNLTTFDTLDFTVFSNQEWTRLHESHAKDIKVYWPDGHLTIGIENTLKI